MKDDVFAVIADPTRRHILQSLAVERLAVGELVEELGVSQPTVSKHLKVLRTAGLVETEAVGQKRFYSITPAPLDAVTNWVEGLQASPTAGAVPIAETSSAADAVPTVEVAPAVSETPAAAPEATAVEPEISSAPEATAVEPETSSAPEESSAASAPAVDVPHPNTAGITFTPLTPFTPVLDNRVDEDVVENQEAVTQETATQEAIRQVVADFEARARVADSQAHGLGGEENGDDRGLLAKLTRWGRRSSR